MSNQILYLHATTMCRQEYVLKSCTLPFAAQFGSSLLVSALLDRKLLLVHFLLHRQNQLMVIYRLYLHWNWMIGNYNYGWYHGHFHHQSYFHRQNQSHLDHHLWSHLQLAPMNFLVCKLCVNNTDIINSDRVHITLLLEELKLFFFFWFLASARATVAFAAFCLL